MTKLAYLQNSYRKELDTTVLFAEGNEVVVEETILYPTGGGQPNDKGIIMRGAEKFNVVDVRKVDGQVVHFVDRDGLKEGEKVRLKVDWERRYKIMKYHTATHVLCAVIHGETGAQITGNQIYEDRTRIDLNLENFDREKIKEYEKKANELFREGRPVDSFFLSREEAMKLQGVVKLANVLPPEVKELRILDIHGVDQQACGGTHLKNISEVGQIEIVKVENKGKNNRRLTFVLKEDK